MFVEVDFVRVEFEVVIIKQQGLQEFFYFCDEIDSVCIVIEFCLYL